MTNEQNSNPSRCKVCGGNARRRYRINNLHGPPDRLDIMQCPKCGLLFAGNALDPETLARAYASIDWSAYYQDIGKTNAGKVSRAMDDLAEIIKSKPRASVIDVGCGHGHFMESVLEAHPGARVAGHELPGESSRTCEEKGFTMYCGDLSEVSEKFDLAVLLDVAEHVPDPNGFFKDIAGLLEADGRIYLHTPRLCFWDSVFLALAAVPLARRLALVWLYPRVSIFHLQLWTDRALKVSLEQAGFEAEYIKPELELSWPVSQYIRNYLIGKYHLPGFFEKPAVFLTDLLLVRPGTLRNKAVVLAQKRGISS